MATTPNYGFSLPTAAGTKISELAAIISTLASELDLAILNSKGAASGTYPEPGLIDSNQSLNSYTSTAVLWASSNPQTQAAARNYPLASAGFLRVISSKSPPVGNFDMLMQQYTAVANGVPTRVFVRSAVRNSGALVWSAWAEITGGGATAPKPMSVYTFSGSKANFESGNQGVSTPIYSSAKSDSNLFTAGAGSLTVKEAGIYSIDFSLGLYDNSQLVNVRAVTGRSFIDLKVNGVTTRSAIPLGEDQTSCTVAAVKLAVGNVIEMKIIQTSGAVAWYSGEVRLFKQT